MGFDYSLSFRAGVYGTKTGLFSRKIKLVIFSRLFAKIGAAHSRPKKYAEGVRTLSTPTVSYTHLDVYKRQGIGLLFDGEKFGDSCMSRPSE